MKGSVLSCLTAVAGLQQVSANTFHYGRSSGVSHAERTHPRLHRHKVVRDNGVPDNDTNRSQYYVVMFQPPAGAVITDFVSTMSVPDISPLPDVGPRYVWPGLEDYSGSFVFQDVLSDNQPHGEWTFATWVVGENEEDEKEYPIHKVSPHGSVTSTFTSKDRTAFRWSEAFSISGTDGSTTGGIPYLDFSDRGALVNAYLAIEVTNDSKWDFGPVTFSNISVTAITNSTSWCISPQFVTGPSIPGGYKYTSSKPEVSVNGSSITCAVSRIVFESP